MAGPQNQTGPSHPAIPLLGSKKELRGARARAPTALRAAGLREAQAEAAQGPTDRRPRGELRPSHAGGLSSGERRAAQRQRGGSRGHCWTGRTRGHIWACPVSGTLGSQIPKQETRWRESRAGVGGGSQDVQAMRPEPLYLRSVCIFSKLQPAIFAVSLFSPQVIVSPFSVTPV